MNIEDYKSYEKEREKNKSNTYASHKSISQQLLNTSIISAHVGYLLTIFDDTNSDGLGGFEYAAVVLISISIFVQICIFLMLTWLFYVDTKTKYGCITAKKVNGFVTAVSGLSLILNISITSIMVRIDS